MKDKAINTRKIFHNMVGQFPQIRSFTFLVTSLSYNSIVKRGMLSRLQPIVKKSTSNMISTSTTSRIPTRGYAKRVIQKAEKPSQVTDSNGLKNNPVTNKGRHYEAARHECKENPDCKNLDCPTLCGTPGDIKAVGHMTSNPNPPVSPGNSTDKVSTTNLLNQNKKQFRVLYQNAHKTGLTQEHVPGTHKLNNDIDFKKKVFDNEDKK